MTDITLPMAMGTSNEKVNHSEVNSHPAGRSDWRPDMAHPAFNNELKNQISANSSSTKGDVRSDADELQRLLNALPDLFSTVGKIIGNGGNLESPADPAKQNQDRLFPPKPIIKGTPIAPEHKDTAPANPSKFEYLKTANQEIRQFAEASKGDVKDKVPEKAGTVAEAKKLEQNEIKEQVNQAAKALEDHDFGKFRRLATKLRQQDEDGDGTTQSFSTLQKRLHDQFGVGLGKLGRDYVELVSTKEAVPGASDGTTTETTLSIDANGKMKASSWNGGGFDPRGKATDLEPADLLAQVDAKAIKWHLRQP